MANNGHGGNVRRFAEVSGRRPEDILDFSANINPLGPPKGVFPLIRKRLEAIVHYPDPDCTALVETISARYGIDRKHVVVGNGSTEILYLLPHAVPSGNALIPVPSYSDYIRAAKLAGLTVRTMPLREEDGFRPDLPVLEKMMDSKTMVFVGQPNNPTGILYDAPALREIALRHPSTVFVVDEAFADFVEGMDSMTRDRPPNVVVLISFTKIYAIPGLRLGCAIAGNDVVHRLKEIRSPWSVNTMAQIAGEAALKDRDYLERSRIYASRQRDLLCGELSSMGYFTVYPGKANYLFVRIDRGGFDAPTLAAMLLREGIAIRVCSNYDGLDSRFFRIAIRTEQENSKLLDLLKKITS